jgi:hypothetical protein
MTTKSTHRSESVARLVVGTAAVIACVLVALPASAGNLTVTSAAANNGTYGLEVTVGSSCTSDADLLLSGAGTITTDQEGCDTITAGNGTSVSGTVTFTAGTAIAFTNGFSVANGSDFTAAIDATLTPFAWVQDDSPNNEVSYSAEFYIDPNTLSITGGDTFEHFVAYSGATPQLRVVMQSGPSLVLQVRDDAGTYHSTSAVGLSTSTFNKVAITWEAAASATASIAVNDGSAASVSGIDTDARRIAFVRWGAIGGAVGSASGAMYLDDFVSWR